MVTGERFDWRVAVGFRGWNDRKKALLGHSHETPEVGSEDTLRRVPDCWSAWLWCSTIAPRASVTVKRFLMRCS